MLTVELQRVNKQLAAGSQTKANNSLLDARDHLIDKLNEYVEVSVSLDERGAAKSFLATIRMVRRLLQRIRSTSLALNKKAVNCCFSWNLRLRGY